MRHGLLEIVRAFKSFSARRMNAIRKIPSIAVWQRSYYEHIIRDETVWERIRGYILASPQR
jgi:REP element-mobilizing transposase RayT